MVVANFLYIIEKFNDPLFTSSTDSTSTIIPPPIPNARQRPAQDHLVSVNRIEKYCGGRKTAPIIQCLRYLQENETDYILPYYSIHASSRPPICSRDYPPMLFHVFWRGPISDKLALMMKSFLFSQPLECSTLYVWLDSNNYTDPRKSSHLRLLQRFIPIHIKFKFWNTREQLSSIKLFADWKNIYHRRAPVSFSDMVRFVVLYKYGGIYIDADVLLLRDMRPLYYANFEFSYRWSFTSQYNTAVLRLRRHSPTSKRIISQATRNKMNFHPLRIRKYLKTNKNYKTKEINKQLYMLPVGLFDPLWLKNDGKQIGHALIPNLTQIHDFFNPKFVLGELKSNNYTESPLDVRKVEGFFPGAFAYHWHNNWNVPIHPNSWAGVLQTAYDEFLMGLRRNLYNEYVVVS
ncbi:6799_t:CDS:1 [Acaulospora morrowiae]|uniref:6799_t:CDS:1 n=1 Tax=Acaulospora morrowiae TaxID=94023 RepID=A0A9N8Z6G8_9GLOM|nr:6799_t:CDS:1 [Acaulospora morrowiae]